MLLCRTLIWVDGEATNISYEDAEGKSRSSFSIIQREWPVGLLAHSVFLQRCN